MNVSALAAGQPRIVAFEERLSAEKLRSALTRGREDLAVIRHAVSRLAEQTPEFSRLRIPPGRDFGPER